MDDKQALKNEKAIYQGKNPNSFCLQNARHARHMFLESHVLTCFCAFQKKDAVEPR